MADTTGANLQAYWRSRSREMGKNYVSVLRSISAKSGAKTRAANRERKMAAAQRIATEQRTSNQPSKREGSMLQRVSQKVRNFFRRG